MIPPEHPKDLFKRQGAEKGRTVEHGAFQPDRTPRKEVGSLEFVTTLVEIPFHCFSVQRTDGMLEENGNGNNHGQFPSPKRSSKGSPPNELQRFTMPSTS